MYKAAERIPLVLAFTPDYFIPAAVCLLSVFRHARPDDCFDVICLLTEPMPENMRHQLHRLGCQRTRYLFIDLQHELQDVEVDDKYTVASCYRLLLPRLLPDYDKVMYIDCDVVVRNNLADLFRKTELGDNYLAGVFEATLDFQIARTEAAGCEPGRYINSGFLIMNLRKLREDGKVDQFLTALRAGYLEFPDQDVLNQVCKGRIMGLTPVYNAIRTFFLPLYKPAFLKIYDEADWQAVQRHGTVHYTGGKPWNMFTVKFDLWWNYYEQLPAEIKKFGEVDKKVYRLFQVYRNATGRLLIHGAQYCYRKLKYGGAV